jgi:hypothetical protein
MSNFCRMACLILVTLAGSQLELVSECNAQDHASILYAIGAPDQSDPAITKNCNCYRSEFGHGL